MDSPRGAPLIAFFAILSRSKNKQSVVDTIEIKEK